MLVDLELDELIPSVRTLPLLKEKISEGKKLLEDD